MGSRGRFRIRLGGLLWKRTLRKIVICRPSYAQFYWSGSLGRGDEEEVASAEDTPVPIFLMDILFAYFSSPTTRWNLISIRSIEGVRVHSCFRFEGGNIW